MGTRRSSLARLRAWHRRFPANVSEDPTDEESGHPGCYIVETTGLFAVMDEAAKIEIPVC
jgi:hypothetical protein